MTRTTPLALLTLPLLAGCFGSGRLHDMAVAHNARAVELMQSGSLAEARGALEVALEYNPDFAEAHANLALIDIRQGRLDRAEARLLRAVALNPDFAEAWTDLAALSLAAGETDEAIVRARRAVSVDPDYAEARSFLVRLLIFRGHLDQAEDQALRLVAVRPEAAEGHALLAMVALAAERLGQARREIARAEAASGDDPIVVEVRGRIAFIEGDWGVAVRDLGATVERRPTEADLRYLHAVALLQAGEVDEAGAELDRVLGQQPGHARALAALAVVEAGRGRGARARTLVARALELRPGLEEAQAICAQLGGTCAADPAETAEP